MALPEYNYSSSGIPSLKLPQYDPSRIEFLTQQEASPYIRDLQSGLSRISSQYYDNPALRESAYATGLSGYGRGVSSVLSGARQAARGVYDVEYEAKERQARADYETRMQEYYMKLLKKAQKEQDIKNERAQRLADRDYQTPSNETYFNYDTGDWRRGTGPVSGSVGSKYESAPGAPLTNPYAGTTSMGYGKKSTPSPTLKKTY